MNQTLKLHESMNHASLKNMLRTEFSVGIFIKKYIHK